MVKGQRAPGVLDLRCQSAQSGMHPARLSMDKARCNPRASGHGRPKGRYERQAKSGTDDTNTHGPP